MSEVSWRGRLVPAEYVDDHERAQDLLRLRIEGRRWGRVRWGRERSWTPDIERSAHCGGCGARLGEFHVSGCGAEECPRCRGQLLACGCRVTRAYYACGCVEVLR